MYDVTGSYIQDSILDHCAGRWLAAFSGPFVVRVEHAAGNS